MVPQSIRQGMARVDSSSVRYTLGSSDRECDMLEAEVMSRLMANIRWLDSDRHR